MAGRMFSVSASPTCVSRPCSTRTASTSRSPPTEARRTGGILIFAISRVRLTGCRAEGLVVREDAHLLVGDLVGGARADRAVRVAPDLELGERRAQRLVEEQAADQRLAGAGHE